MPVLDNIINCVYIINLERDRDRLPSIFGQVSKIFSGKIHRISATDGQQIDKSIKDQYLNRHYVDYLDNSVAGCAISHIRTWTEFYKTGFSSCLILEDDVIWNLNDIENTQDELPNIVESADIIYLGSFGLNRPKALYKIDDIILKKCVHAYGGVATVKNSKTYKNWLEPEFPVGLYGYILTRRGCKKLLYLIGKDKICQHIDIQLNYYRDQLIMYSARKPWLENVFDRSSLASKHPKLLNYLCKNVYLSDKTPLWWKLSQNIYGIQLWFVILSLGILLWGWPLYILSIILYLGKQNTESPSWKSIIITFSGVLFVRESINSIKKNVVLE